MWDVEVGGVSIFHTYAEQVHITLWVKRGGMVNSSGFATAGDVQYAYSDVYSTAYSTRRLHCQAITNFLPSWNRGAADGGILKDAGPAQTYLLNINSRQRGIAPSAADPQPRLPAPVYGKSGGSREGGGETVCVD